MTSKEETQDDRLLIAAARLFRVHGVAGASIRMIAAEAGMLPGSVTYRYATRESLVVAVMERGAQVAARGVRLAIAGQRDPMERLRLALRAHIEVLLSEDAAFVLLFDGDRIDAGVRARAAGLLERYEALWDGLMFEAAGSGALVPGLDLRLARLFIFGAAAWVTRWSSPLGGRDPEAIAEAFVGLLGLGVLDTSRRPEDVGAALAKAGAMEPGWPTAPPRKKARRRSGG